MKLRAFREHAVPGELLAIEPKALTGMFSQWDCGNVTENGITVVTISGPTEHHSHFWFDSYDAIAERTEAAFADEDTRIVVHCIDSPGGTADGAFELHDKIRRLRKKHGKPLYAFANESACSAAYAIASASDEIWTTRSGRVGSIGVIGSLVDVTEANRKAGVKVVYLTTGARKADGRPDRKLTPEIVAAQQAHVDHYGSLFFRSVAKAREMDVEAVVRLEAGVFFGKHAVRAGLADGVSSWDAFVATVGSSTRGPTRTSTPKNPGKPEMPKLLKLIKAHDEAEAALVACKDSSERKDLATKFKRAALALEAAKAEEEEEEEESSDGGSSDGGSSDGGSSASGSEEEEEESSDGGSSDGGSSDGGSSMSTDAEKAQAADFQKRKTGLRTPGRLLRLCQKVTGKTRVEEVFDALDGMGIRAQHGEKMSKRVEKLEADLRKSKVDMMLDRAQRHGKVSKAERASLRDVGVDSPEKLRAILDTRPKKVRTLDDGAPRPGADAEGGVRGRPSLEDQRKALASGGKHALAAQDQETRDMVNQMAAGAGKDPETFWAEMVKQNPALNGAGGRLA